MENKKLHPQDALKIIEMVIDDATSRNPQLFGINSILDDLDKIPYAKDIVDKCDINESYNNTKKRGMRRNTSIIENTFIL